MTEREFREKLAAEPGFPICGSQANRAVDVAREAGLEFAPEPVRLPEEIRLSGECCRLLNPDKTALSVGQMAIVVERCNAYPGLRKAADNLLYALGVSRGRQVEDSARALGIELAKGPSCPK